MISRLLKSRQTNKGGCPYFTKKIKHDIMITIKKDFL